MENIELLQKYDVSHGDWRDLNLVEIKMKAEIVIYAFGILENVLAPHISPVESNLISETKNSILEYLDACFINTSYKKK